MQQNIFTRSGEEFQDALFRGEDFQNQFHIPDQVINELFNIAQSHYRHREYDKAKQIFANLTLLKPSSKFYWVALGGAQVSLKEYKEALDSYACALLIDRGSPMPYYSSAYCCLKLGNLADGISFLNKAIEIAHGNSIYDSLKSKLLALLSELKSDR